MRIQALSKMKALVQLRKAFVAYLQDSDFTPISPNIQKMIEEKAKSRYSEESTRAKDEAKQHVGLPLAERDVDMVTAQIRTAYTQADMLALALGATYNESSTIHPQIASFIRSIMRQQARIEMKKTGNPSIIDGLEG